MKTLSQIVASPTMSDDQMQRDVTESEALEPSSSHGINPRDRGLELIDPLEEFGNDHPIILEIGSGKGRFLISGALEHPDRNYVGIEIALQYYRIIKERVEKRNLPNVRVINYDARRVISTMFGDRSVREIHVYFPDPWPKKRQKKRRFVQVDVLKEVSRILEDDGSGLFVTDHQGYYEDSIPVFSEVFEIEHGEVTDTNPRTNYEVKYREEGRRIFEIRFRKPER